MHAAGDIDLQLIDSHGKIIAYSNSITDDENIFRLVPVGGTYYIRVYYDDEGNNYDLWWDDVEVLALDFWENDDDWVSASDLNPD